MSNHNFFCLVVLSPWPIFYSIMLYYASVYDRRFSFLIVNKTQIVKYMSRMLGVLGLMTYIFLFRLWGNSRSLDLGQTIKNFQPYLALLNFSDILFLLLFSLFIIIFWVMALGWFFICIKRRLLALYLYFSQYQMVNDFFDWLRILHVASILYILRRVEIFTKNDTICALAWNIWPNSIRQIKKILFRYLLVYLLIFDIVVNHGQITKFFKALPWFYIFTLYEGFWKLFLALDKAENLTFSINMYGYGTRYHSRLKKK